MTNHAEPRRLLTHDASEAFVESKIEFLTDTDLWPLRQQMDPESWLTNFGERERPFAYNLLNVFLYYNNDLVNALMIGAFQRVCAHVVRSAASASGRARPLGLVPFNGLGHVRPG